MYMALLDDVFADRIISKIIWPPRSPDVSARFFFLWSAMENSVYSKNPHTIDDFKMAITEYIRNVDRAILNTVFENTVRRVNKCLETGGGNFNPLKPELNPICYLLALLAHHFLHVSRIRVKSLTLR